MIHDPQRTDREGAGQGPGERVAKALARAGVASRREIERLIEAGRVAINGKVLTTPAIKVAPGDILTVDGEVVGEAEPARLFRYHKPVGLVTSHADPQGRPTVFDGLPPGLPRLISVGRLDLNSEGLMLLTNDGGLARALEMPSTGVVRRYRARAHGRITQERLDKLKDGITVEGVRYGSIEAKLDKVKDGPQGANVWISVTLSEGKNREVRRVLEALGLKVNRLMRLAYGPFALGTLGPGEIEEVGPRVIRDQLAQHIAPENLPKGDRTQFVAPKSTARRRTSEPAPQREAEEPAKKKVYKAGWAKPKIKAGPPRPFKPKAKQVDGPPAKPRAPSRSPSPPRTSAARPPAPRPGGGPRRRG
ncbi:MAG TPA: pseudouridine synthase [Phenylobacterium sp.]